MEKRKEDIKYIIHLKIKKYDKNISNCIKYKQTESSLKDRFPQFIKKHNLALCFLQKKDCEKIKQACKSNKKGIKDNTNSKVKSNVKTWSNNMYKAQRIYNNNKPVCDKTTGQIKNIISGQMRI